MSVLIDFDACDGCGECIYGCPVNALDIEGSRIAWSEEDCINCGTCVKVCPVQALSLLSD